MYGGVHIWKKSLSEIFNGIITRHINLINNGGDAGNRFHFARYASKLEEIFCFAPKMKPQ
jgi:hypothetical protein